MKEREKKKSVDEQKIDVGMLNIEDLCVCVFLKRCPVKAKYRQETTRHGTLFQDKAQIYPGVL